MKSLICTNRTGLLQDDPEKKAHGKGYERNPPSPGELRGLVQCLLVYLKEEGQPKLTTHLQYNYSDEKSDYEDDCEYPPRRSVRGPTVKPDLVGLEQTGNFFRWR